MNETNWWRVLSSTGDVWCETSSEEQARHALTKAPGGTGRLQRMYEVRHFEWRDEE